MISDRRFVVALLVGVSTFAGLSVLQAQKTVINPTPPPTLRVEYIPNPNDIVNLKAGTTYIVPQGKILIITDWSSSTSELPHPVQNGESISNKDLMIKIGGTVVWAGGYSASIVHADSYQGQDNAYGMVSSGGGSLSGSLRNGIRAEAGQSVDLSVTGGNTEMYASGYLYPAQ
ncbi:MAG: hypothetical protein DWQ01_08770 [Planctomycetota bacterium]|nr:MAG: hypothetical protein DWQ01_08770 [Planctomycetota bacterium]